LALIAPCGGWPGLPKGAARAAVALVRQREVNACAILGLVVVEDAIALVVAALAQQPSAVGRELARGLRELRDAGFEIDYLEIREEETLRPVTASVAAHSRVFAAVQLGRTRLIDNLPIR